MTLLEVSFSGAVFIIAVVIIRAIAINSLPKKNVSCFVGNGAFEIGYSVYYSVCV